MTKHEGVTYEAVNYGTTVIIPDTAKDNRVNPELLAEDIETPVRALIAIPLSFRDDNVKGVLHINCDAPQDFSDVVITILKLMSNFASLSVQKTLDYTYIRNEKLGTDKLLYLNNIGVRFAHYISNIAGTIPLRALDILESADLPLKIRDDIEWIYKDGIRLNEFINKIQAGFPKEEIRIVIDINSLLQEVCNNQKLFINSNLQTCDYKFEAELPNIFADKQRLYDAFYNVLNNAIHTTKNKSAQITIETFQTTINRKVAVGIKISNTGSIEISEKNFSPKILSDKGGLGVGLWITKLVIEQQGGSIEISEGTGAHKTTDFTIVIPSSEEMYDYGNL